MPIDVIVFFIALAVWAGVLVHAWKTERYQWFVRFGLALLVVLNVRYFIDGQAESIAFFVAIYDVLDNIGVSGADIPGGMATCTDCSAWGDRFAAHPSWGVAFYERFANGPTSRNNLLYGHIGANTVAFLLMHYQLARPGGSGGRHRLIGRVGFGAITLGTVCAMLLAAQHGSVGEYQGAWSTWGFASMSLVVWGCAVMSVMKIRNGDVAAHRIWSIRYAGSMWGAFWLFRVMLFVLGPFTRGVDAGALQFCIWFSAPLGVALAEWIRRTRLDRDVTAPSATVGPDVAVVG